MGLRLVRVGGAMPGAAELSVLQIFVAQWVCSGQVPSLEDFATGRGSILATCLCTYERDGTKS
jgi:hypothetical protein